jgi:hypothetical protein
MPEAFNLNNAGASVESVEYENRSFHQNSLISPAPNHPTQSWKGFEKLNPLNQMNSELFGRRGIVLRNISNNFVEILLGFGS